MAPHKTRAIVLQVLPYQESSSILHLYTEQLGLVHGIAKGIRRPGRDATTVERGFLIELLVYVKPHRTLHTLGSVALGEFFPALRSDLLAGAGRDAALELSLRAIHDQEPHSEIFDCLLALMRSLDATPAAAVALVWRFYIDFAGLMGFAPQLCTCGVCGAVVQGRSGAALRLSDGSITCPACTPPAERTALLPAAVLDLLTGDAPAPGALPGLGAAEKRRITRLLAAFCQHHFEMRATYRALDFLCEML